MGTDRDRRLLRTHLGLTLVGSAGMGVLGLKSALLFALMAGLGYLYLLASFLTIQVGMSDAKPRHWLAVLLYFGKLALLLLTLRGMMVRYPSFEGPLLGGTLLHVLTLFVEAVRRATEGSHS